MKSYIFTALLLFLGGCAGRTGGGDLINMQIIDRNGFTETIGSKERLSPYSRVDFSKPQPYQRVLRVFSRNEEGKSRSVLTSYHPNGQIWQWLDSIDGRAHGNFQEWHANGRLRIDLHVIDGTADLTELAQKSWLFEGKAAVFDENGNLQAEIFYEKGVLSAPSLHYHPNGNLQKRVPYVAGEIDGEVELFNDQGKLLEKISYKRGVKEGLASGYWENGQLQYEEVYENAFLKTARYVDRKGAHVATIDKGTGFKAQFDPESGSLSELHECQGGRSEGVVKLFSPGGCLKTVYKIKEGMKEGEEREYYPGSALTKILCTWHEDALQGPIKTWYPDGSAESSCSYHQNKKQGLSFAWYRDGDLMLSEEYHQDSLVAGSYFERGSKRPISKVVNGKGLASLFDPDGILNKKIPYEGGLPLLEGQ